MDGWMDGWIDGWMDGRDRPRSWWNSEGQQSHRCKVPGSPNDSVEQNAVLPTPMDFTPRHKCEMNLYRVKLSRFESSFVTAARRTYPS